RVGSRGGIGRWPARAPLLVRVHAAVGELDRVPGRACGRGRRVPERSPEGQVTDSRMIPQAFAQPPHDGLAGELVDAREKDADLVSSDSGDEPLVADRRRGQGGERGEQLVAYRVPVRVVRVLEVVDVAEDPRARRSAVVLG